MNVMGIDPGQKGGIAFLFNGQLMWTCSYAPASLDSFLLTHYVDLIVVEKVHAMPAQGVTSMFTFGRGYGEILGLCRAYGFTEASENLLLVPPQTWKKRFGLLKCPKSASVAEAMKRFPGVDFKASVRAKKPSDGLAEAALIGLYGYQERMEGMKNGP